MNNRFSQKASERIHQEYARPSFHVIDQQHDLLPAYNSDRREKEMSSRAKQAKRRFGVHVEADASSTGSGQKPPPPFNACALPSLSARDQPETAVRNRRFSR
jgi:hypothetical protein